MTSCWTFFIYLMRSQRHHQPDAFRYDLCCKHSSLPAWELDPASWRILLRSTIICPATKNFFQELNVKIGVLSKKYTAVIKLEKDTNTSVKCFTEYKVGLVCMRGSKVGSREGRCVPLVPWNNCCMGGRKQPWLYLHLISLPKLEKQGKKSYIFFYLSGVSIIWAKN